MTESRDVDLLTALMLLEMGMDWENPEYGSILDYVSAAHSYVQFSIYGRHSWDKATEMVAKIHADAAIEWAMWREEKGEP